MAKIRVNKTKDYTVMSNVHLKNKMMSLKAKGLLSVMLSLPDDWEYSIAGLCAICKENETAIKSTLNELKEFGYLTITKEKPTFENGGRFNYIYDIYEQPIERQGIEKQAIENLCVERQGIENQRQLNINKSNTKKENIKEINNTYISKKFIPPTYEEVKEYALSLNRLDLAKAFYDYFSVGNWIDSKGNKVKNWKQKFITWANKNPKNAGTIETFDADEFFEAALKRTYGDDWKGN